jgi:streptomycin 6-kinase
MVAGSGRPVRAGAGGFTAPAELADGTKAVLKLAYPHRESEHEADALTLWDGDGAVRLLARDDAGFTMLIERCEPGTPLSERGADAALAVLIALLPRLWKPADAPFHTLAERGRLVGFVSAGPAAGRGTAVRTRAARRRARWLLDAAR